MKEIIVPVAIALGVLGGVGAILGIAIGICSKILYVEQDERIEIVTSMLPGANCGGCGFAGCSGFATSIVENNTSPNGCKPCKPEQVEKIKEYLADYKLAHEKGN